MSAPPPRSGSGERLPVPDGAGRLTAVRRLESTAVGSRALGRLTDLAVRLLDASAAQVSLFGEAEIVVAGSGLPPGSVGRQRPLPGSLCELVAEGGPQPLVIADAATDPRAAGRTLAPGGTVGAFLGMPLASSAGHLVGAFCVVSERPREWPPADIVLLRQLADSVATELELSALSREYEGSRLRFELAIDAAGIGSWDWDLASGRLTWDGRLDQLFGFEPGTFDETIEGFTARLHPDDRARVTEALRSAIETCGAYEAEYRVLLPGGETRWVLARGRALGDDRGVAVRVLGAAYDTTGQRHGDVRVARVLEAMNAAFFALDRQWRFSYVNAEAERVLHRPRAELLGGSIWELFPHAVGSDFEANYRGAMATGEERVFEAYYPEPLDAWYEVRAWPAPDGVSVYFIDITERRAAETRARRGAARLALLAQVSSLMTAAVGSSRSDEIGLQKVAQAVVPVLGDWVILSLADENGRMRDVASWHREPASRADAARYAALRLPALDDGAPIMRALASGELVTIPDVDAVVGGILPDGEVREVFRRLGPRSAITTPLVARGRTLGALSIYRGPSRPLADPDDVATARQVAERVALALDNARLFSQQRQMAESLQRSMLTAPPEPDHAEIVVRYLPAMEVAEVGGDWYDAFLQPGGATMLVIGDVVGHDTEAAATMGQLRGLLRGIAYRQPTGPAEVLRELDVAIAGLELGALATAAIARLEQTPGERAAGRTRLRWSNAGHPPPLVLHADGRVVELAGERAELMLGVDPSVRRTEATVTLERGSTVLLYTDGLVEGRDLPLDEGMAVLRAAVAELADRPLAQLCDGLIERLRPGGLQDDIALVALRLHPQDRPRPPEAGPRHAPPIAPPEK